MNARSVRKRLMKHRHYNRAYLVVRVPLNIVDAPPSRPDFPGFRECMEGCWKNDETGEVIMIEEEYSKGLPPWEAGNCIFFVEQDTPEGWFKYYEGYRYTPEDGDFKRSILPEETVGKERAWQLWDENMPSTHPLLNAFARVSGCKGKSRVYSHDFQYVYFRYSVKTYQHWSKAMFCSGVSHALKMAKRMGVPVRIMKGCFE